MTLLFICINLVWSLVGNLPSHQDKPVEPELRVSRTADFQVDGTGQSAAWEQAEWVMLPMQEGRVSYETKIKTLYSETGIYFLFQCEDQQLNATIEEDFGSLFREDVVEVFLRPDPSLPIYLEYELSPLNYELPLLIVNIDGKFSGWRPSGYGEGRKVVHATSVQGGERVSGAAITGWTGELFIPFQLLSPMVQGRPEPGTVWKANCYRIDYDQGYASWTWQRTTPGVRGSFHQMEKFGSLIFE
ncbi:carbohydrate-binding family 9-like protein [Parapedobacter lycopersici]|uniref:carbohydrate-binding family 9-like protein n=1 Tax=Parapedobacter lycopersici TaxID=1864939 RepID=UPI00333EF209